MTNQSGETVYNVGMMEEIFGAYEPGDTPAPEGIYRSARTVLSGPLKLCSAGYTGFDGSEDEFFLATGKTVQKPYGDLLRLPLRLFVMELGLLLLWALGAVYSAGCLIAALIRRLRRRPALDGSGGLRAVCAAVQLIVLLLLAYTVWRLLSYAPSTTYRWVPVLIALCAAAEAVLLVLQALKKSTRNGGRKTRLLHMLSCLSLAASLANVLYWELWQFWKL